jgi:hypothetical protein
LKRTSAFNESTISIPSDSTPNTFDQH